LVGIGIIAGVGKNMNSKKIKFTNVFSVPEIYSPEPASKNIPEWYKHMTSYSGGDKVPFEFGGTAATIKKCIPVFDMITAGYIIKTYCDIKVSWNGVVHEFMPSGNSNAISYHVGEQAEFHPKVIDKLISIPKFINPWAIETSSGYSSIFIPPSHRDTPFEILPGIVDTDSYSNQIHFPFTMKDQEFEGVIPAGTPVVQIIPFKRDSWTSEVENDSSKGKHYEHDKLVRSVFFDAYKNLFWKKKSYK
jgi:hypothetical protein